jgi:phosphatidylinositol-3-phosphatase
MWVSLRPASLAAAVAFSGVALALFGGSSPASAAAPTPSAPCIGSSNPTHYAHVIVIVEENKAYEQVMGQAPYQTAVAKACGYAANMHAETYPSLPNYLAMTSGVVPDAVAGRDCQPSGSCLATAPTIFSQTSGSWRVYAESMPSNCSRTNTQDGLYVPRHTAAPYFTDLAAECLKRQLPLGTTTAGAFASDLKADTLPRFALVVPNTTNDAHGGCLSCADAWLARWIPQIVASPAYQDGSTAVFVTYDSDNASAKNHIATTVIAPSVKPGTVGTGAYTHYSMLRTIECMLGLSGRLGGAATAPGMRAEFHL